MTTLAQPGFSDDRHARGFRLAGYDVVRVLLGLLLLTAAAFKGFELATEPVANSGLLTSRWLLVIVVEFEFLFGLWLLAGLRPRLTRVAAIVVFTAFGAVAAYKGVTGEASCGCFGKVPVNPWYTLILDVAAICALLASRPMSQAPRHAALQRFGWPVVAVIAVLVGVPGGYVMSIYEPAALADDGVIIGPGNLVILQPEKWVGKQFPLFEHIDVGDTLSKGKWIVLLHHDGCPDCVEAVPRYRRMSHELRAGDTDLAVALIAIPPVRHSATGLRPNKDRPLRGALADVREWLVTTPTVALLEDGHTRATWAGKAPDKQELLAHTPTTSATADCSGPRHAHDESAGGRPQHISAAPSENATAPDRPSAVQACQPPVWPSWRSARISFPVHRVGYTSAASYSVQRLPRHAHGSHRQLSFSASGQYPTHHRLSVAGSKDTGDRRAVHGKQPTRHLASACLTMYAVPQGPRRSLHGLSYREQHSGMITDYADNALIGDIS